MKNVIEIYNWWLEIIDKAGDPSWEDFEWSSQFNMACVSLLKDEYHNLHNRGENAKVPYAFENTSIDLVKWHPQIKPVMVATNNVGIINWSILEGLIDNREVFHINSIELKNGEEWEYVRYRRHNDNAKLRQNVFKKPLPIRPTWVGYSDYIQIEPKVLSELRFSLFAYPIELNLDFNNPANNIDTDLTKSAIMSILFRMATINGIKIREQQLYEFSNAQEKSQ